MSAAFYFVGKDGFLRAVTEASPAAPALIGVESWGQAGINCPVLAHLLADAALVA